MFSSQNFQLSNVIYTCNIIFLLISCLINDFKTFYLDGKTPRILYPLMATSCTRNIKKHFPKNTISLFFSNDWSNQIQKYFFSSTDKKNHKEKKRTWKVNVKLCTENSLNKKKQLIMRKTVSWKKNIFAINSVKQTFFFLDDYCSITDSRFSWQWNDIVRSSTWKSNSFSRIFPVVCWV